MPSNSWWESLALKKMSCCTVESLKFHSFQPQLCHHLPCPNLYLCECQNMCSKSLNESNRADQVVVDMVERKKKQHSTIYPLRQVETVSYKPYHLMIQMAISTDTFYKQKWNHTLGTYIYKFNKSLTYLLLTFPTLFYYYFFFPGLVFLFSRSRKDKCGTWSKCDIPGNRWFPPGMVMEGGCQKIREYEELQTNIWKPTPFLFWTGCLWVREKNKNKKSYLAFFLIP